MDLQHNLELYLIKKDHFGDKLLEPTPIVDDLIRNQKGEPFAIVHQYDRNPQSKTIVLQAICTKITYIQNLQKKSNPIGFTYEKWLDL